MKKIFGHLFKSKHEDDMHDVIAWLEDLNEMDDITALKVATQKIATSFDHPEITIEQQIEMLIEVENICQPKLDKLSTQFVKVTNMKAELENSISQTCYTYCRQSYIYHLKLVEIVLNPSKFRPDVDLSVTMIARTINAAFMMSKWRMFMQEHPPTKVWLQVYLLYKVAQKLELLNTPTTLFPGNPATTISAFVVQICMLGGLLQASVNKHHIEIASKLLRTWITHAHISNKHNAEQYLFFVDLEKDIPARRMRNIAPNANYRYWELNDFEKLTQVAITVTDRGEMPESLINAKIEHVKVLNETLNILLSEWRRNNYVRQRRSEPREATLKNAKVHAGIHDISNQVLNANQVFRGLRIAKDGKSLDELLRSHTVLKQTTVLNINSGSLDTWIITDQSKTGLGARVNKYANILARPEKIVGLVMEDDPGKVVIGIITNVKPTSNTLLKVGIKIMSHQAMWMQLELSEESGAKFEAVVGTMMSSNSAVEMGLFPGIYLPKEPGISDRATLLLPKINFRPNAKYHLHMSGKVKTATLGTPIESHDDWVRIPV